MPRGRKAERRCKVAGLRFEIATHIVSPSYEKLIADSRWAEIVNYFDLKKIRSWPTQGLPIHRIAAVANFFGVLGSDFQDDRLAHRDFEKKIYRALAGLINGTQGATLSSTSSPIREIDINVRYPHFQARPEELGHAFDVLIAECTRNFIERDDIIAELDNFLEESAHLSGYFIIRGEPGIGKSAFIAWLVKKRGYIHHFNIALQSIHTTAHFLRNVCSQLISRYGLDYPVWPSRGEADGAFLNQLLVEVGQRLTRRRKLIIAIDALDEVTRTELPARANLLCLPSSLPDNVYIIATTRHQQDCPLLLNNQKWVDIPAHGKANQSAAHRYIKASGVDSILEPLHRQEGAVSKDSIEILLHQSEGNFMYLRHVLKAMRQKRFKYRQSHFLPEGLKGYYHRHWLQMCQQDSVTFERICKPVMHVLAAAKEPVSVSQFATLTGLETKWVRELIREWYEFLHEEDWGDGDKRYRLYHSSFRSFIKQRVDPDLSIFKSMLLRYYSNFANSRGKLPAKPPSLRCPAEPLFTATHRHFPVVLSSLVRRGGERQSGFFLGTEG